MSPLADIVWPASQLSRKGERRAVALDERVAVGLSTGSGESMNPKQWVNEDSLCVHRLADGSLLCAVADAHWGGAAGEVMVQGLRPAFERARGATALDRLLLAVRSVDARWHIERPQGDGSETTLLACHVQERSLSWVSVGDSLLFLLGARGCSLRNPPSGAFPVPFLGGFPLAKVPTHVRPDCGTLGLKPGELVLLASDGLEPGASALDPTDVLRVLQAQQPLVQRLEHLLARADEPARGGGADNLALVALQVG